MSHFAQRIRLIHQLRQLTATKEIPNHGRKSFRIDQLLRRHSFRVHVEQGHPLFDQAFRPAQPGPTLIGKKFPDGSDAATSQMINIIGGPLTQTEVDQIAGCSNHVFPGQDPGQKIGFQTKLLVQFVPTHSTDVVAFRIEKEPLQQRLCVRHSGWIARA